jgi:hypothetical protein
MRASLVPRERSSTVARHCIHFGPSPEASQADPAMARGGTALGAKAARNGQTFDYLGLALYGRLRCSQSTVCLTCSARRFWPRCVRATGFDMGTGCGANSILAARAGADVLALDSNPEAV